MASASFPGPPLSLSGLCMRCLSAARQGCVIGHKPVLTGSVQGSLPRQPFVALPFDALTWSSFSPSAPLDVRIRSPQQAFDD